MPEPSESAAFAEAAARLCPDCGLCCNGVLFDQVLLQPGDHAKALTAKGLKIKKGQRFNQPCTALCGTLCQIYHHRPVRCRRFECRQYRQVAAGEISYETALQCIGDVKTQVLKLEEMLAGCGGGNGRKPLAQRFATAREADPDAVAGSGLGAAMSLLAARLDRDFRGESAKPAATA